MASNYVDRTIRIPAPQPTVTLDPDKYLGTIGLSSNKPAGSPAPHYTAFPEDAKTGNWLQVVSEFTLAGQLLLKGEEWYCFRAKTDTQAAVWTRSQVGEKQPDYITIAQNVGEIRAFLNTKITQSVDSNKGYYVIWSNILCSGIYKDFNKNVLSSNIIDITPGLEPNLEHDFYVSLEFENDKVGSRYGVSTMFSYYPTEDSRFDVNLEEYGIKKSKSNADDPINLIRPGVILPRTEPLDETALTYGFSAYVLQNSGNPLKLKFAELKLKTYNKKY